MIKLTKIYHYFRQFFLCVWRTASKAEQKKLKLQREIMHVALQEFNVGCSTAVDLGFNFRGCTKWNLRFGKHSEPPKGVLGATPEANTFRAIYTLKLA